tara:strand:+ start:3496 stop:3816 length:321 start_codon:yes stop_codon:yes gene_type:complete
MSILEIPVRNDLPAFEFRVVFEGVTYFLQFKYNKRRLRWLIDIQNQDKIDILSGIPLLTNVDLKSKYKSLGLPPGVFLVFDTEGRDYNPTQFDLSDRVKFLYKEAI